VWREEPDCNTLAVRTEIALKDTSILCATVQAEGVTRKR
jgi:hypothetical protein